LPAQINEVPQDLLGPLELPKTGRAAEDTNGKKQHQQAVAYGLHPTEKKKCQYDVITIMEVGKFG